MTALHTTLRATLLLVALAIPLVAASGAHTASFDCATARAADETTVCGDCALAQLDVKMATLYSVLGRLVPMGQRGDLQDAQRGFLAQRARCGSDAACLSHAYHGRLGELEQALDRISARGPF